MSKLYETYQDDWGDYYWRLTESDDPSADAVECICASSQGFPSEAEAHKNAWRVVSGLTECLGVTSESAKAPVWLYDGLNKLRVEKPERWAELNSSFRVFLDVLQNDVGLPPEIAGNVDRLLEDVLGGLPA